MTPSVRDAAVGDELGNCLLVHLIREDESAQLFQALHKSLRHSVTIAVPKARLLVDQPGRRNDLLSFARKLAPLSHPHLFRLLDYVDTAPVPFFVFEYVKGLSLAQLLQQTGRLRWDRAVRLLTQMAGALSVASQADLTHGRLWPGQILVALDGSGKLIFDIPAFRQPLKAGDAALEYLSPEQLTSARTVNQQADIFSLGVVGYEILSGKRPFAADNRASPPRLHDLLLEIPPPASNLVQQMLAADPRQRIDSYDTLLQELQSIRLPGWAAQE